MGKVGNRYNMGDVVRGYYTDQDYRIIMIDPNKDEYVYTVIPSELKYTYQTSDMKTLKESEIRIVVWTANQQADHKFSMCTCGAKSVGDPSHAHYCKAYSWRDDYEF